MDHQQCPPEGKVRNSTNINLKNGTKKTKVCEGRPFWCAPDVNHSGTQMRRHFMQEGPSYNIFASYRKDDDFCQVWNLTNEQRENLFEKYLIASEVEPSEMKIRLNGIMEKNMDSLENGEGYDFVIPNCIKTNMQYDSTVGINLLLKDRVKTRSFGNQSQRYAATVTAATIPKVLDNMEDNLRFSKRTVYYTDKDLYGTQERSDAVLTDICCMTRARLENLNVVPAGTGMILGDVVLKLKNGFSKSCSIGALIPNPKLVERIEVHEGAGDIQYILLLEKLTMMVYLSNFNYHKKNKCILISGGGMPSIVTREFLRFLKEQTGLPVYGLSDPDPEGAEIMSVYARGSVLSVYDNFNISVPAIRWIGMSSSDLEYYGLVLPDSSYSLLSVTDLKTLDSVSNPNLSDEWSYRLNHMKHFNKKTSFEELQKFGNCYLAETLLPSMIRDAAENRPRVKKDEDGPRNGGGDDTDENNGEGVTDGKEQAKILQATRGDVHVGTPNPAKEVMIEEDTIYLRRSDRKNKYDGFKAPSLAEGRVRKKAKVTRSREPKATMGAVHVGTLNLAKKDDMMEADTTQSPVHVETLSPAKKKGLTK